jgi:branched-chain amino acid transport system substrate-binding protein
MQIASKRNIVARNDYHLSAQRSTMRIRSFLMTCCIVTLTVMFPSAARSQTVPYEINVLLPLTGPAAFLGKAMAQAIQVGEKTLNARGGIKGRPLKFVLLDDGSSPQTGLQIANSLIAKHVPIFLGSAFAAVCDAYSPVVARTGPVNYCISPLVHPAAGSFVFSSGVSGRDNALVIARYFKDRGFKRIAMITSTDASGQEMETAFPSVLQGSEFSGLQIVDAERFNVSDTGVQAQIAKMKSATPQAVLTWTTGSAFGTLLRGLRDAGLDEVPIAASNGNQLYAALGQFATIVPNELLFSGYRAMTESPTSRSLRQPQAEYFNAFREAGIRPDVAAAIVWDSLMLVGQTLNRLPSDPSAEQIRAALENVHGWPGINGEYDFRDGSQRGIGPQALVMHRWDPVKNQFIVVSKPGGYVR